MALDLSTTYSGKIDTTSDPTGYPYGKPQNVTTPGDNTGTPWDEDIASDLAGFFQAVLSGSGITPSGDPDKVGASDILNGLKSIVGYPTKVAVNNCATTNSGTNVIIAEGTLVLPAGKKWKWVKIVFTGTLNGISYWSLGQVNKIDVDAINDTANFSICSPVTNSTYITGNDTMSVTVVAEGPPSVTDQDITIKMYSASVPVAPSANDVSAYIIGECI